MVALLNNLKEMLLVYLIRNLQHDLLEIHLNPDLYPDLNPDLELYPDLDLEVNLNLNLLLVKDQEKV